MTDYTPDLADVELADAVARQLGYKDCNDMSIYEWGLSLSLPRVVAATVAALVAAGPLVPADWCACRPGETCGYHLAHPSKLRAKKDTAA